MNWPSLAEFWRACVHFFHMGGYGLYVWGSYGVTFVLLGAEVLMLLKRKRNLGKRENPYVVSETQLESSLQEIQ